MAAEITLYRAAQVCYNVNAVHGNNINCDEDDISRLMFAKVAELRLPTHKCAQILPQINDRNARGMCFGISQARGGKKYCTNADETVREMIRLVNRLIASVDPSFRYTSLQINLNPRARIRIDDSNVGPSMALAVGDFEGGHLIEFAEQIFVVPPRRWTITNGRNPHMVLPFVGSRASIIAFTHTSAAQDNGALIEQAKALGMHTPTLEEAMTMQHAQAICELQLNATDGDRIEDAWKSYEHLCECIADYASECTGANIHWHLPATLLAGRAGPVLRLLVTAAYLAAAGASNAIAPDDTTQWYKRRAPPPYNNNNNNNNNNNSIFLPLDFTEGNWSVLPNGGGDNSRLVIGTAITWAQLTFQAPTTSA